MKFLRPMTLVACVFFSLSTVAVDAGPLVSPRHTGSQSPTAVWIIFGCAGSIVFTAYVKHFQQHRELTPLEASTCGLAYWFAVQRPPR